MNSDEIFDVIEAIASESSKSAKEALIRKHGGDNDFVAVLEAALNPFKTYGIAKRPETPSLGVHLFSKETWALLNNLEARTLTGNAAREALSDQLNGLSPRSRELLWRIVSKDLRAGFSESTVNKAIPGTIPTFDCMLAHPFEHGRIKRFPVAAEPKLDGVRVLAFVDVTKPEVKFFSRSGKEFTTFDHLKDPLIQVIDDFRANLRLDQDFDDADVEYFADMGCEDFAVVFDGEIVSGSFNKTVSEVRRKDEQAKDAIFNVFDVLPMELFSQSDKVPSRYNYNQRREVLEDMMGKLPKTHPVQLLPRYLVSSVAEIHSLYESVRARGLEGLIIKDTAAPYYRRRNHAWMKIKAEESVDVPIVGFEEGTGKYEGMLGALVVKHKGVHVNVGTGLSDSQRESFWHDRHLLTGRLCEVQYHEETPDGSLRHPRFIRFRDDKS